MPDLTTRVCVLWARSPRYTKPQFVAAWSEGLVDAWSDYYEEKLRAAREEWHGWGDASDGPWTFWTTYMDLPTPVLVASALDENQQPRESST